MMRQLIGYPATEPRELMHHLRSALTGDGPAVMPTPDAHELPRIGDVPARIAVVIETSGSTGTPKRVMLSAEALLASAAASSAALNTQGQWMLALPAHYIAGTQILVRSIIAETEPVILPEGSFDPQTFAHFATTMTAKKRLTSLVPVQLARIIERAATDTTVLAAAQRFDAILVGGQSIDPELHNAAHQLGLAITLTYGASETCGGCVYDGTPIGDTDARIINGQIELRGTLLAEGYLHNPELTAQTFIEEDGIRWYRTNDLGTITNGRIHVNGRADSIIISGGVKVSLDAVERIVRTIKHLDNAVVVGIRHPTWGESSAVAYTGPTEITLATIRATVADALGTPAAPSRIIHLPHIPQLASGKPDRCALRDLISERGHR